MFLKNNYSTTLLPLYYCYYKLYSATTMAPVQTFGAVDIRGRDYSGPPAKDVPPVEDAEMVKVPEQEKDEVAVPAALAPRFECASL